MPSRRRLLATTGTAFSVGGLSGCLSELGFGRTGHLQLKGISIEWEYGKNTYRDQPLQILYDIDEQKIRGRYEPRFFDDIQPLDVTVSDAVHDRLDSRFDVEYAVGVCGSDFARDGEPYGCNNRRASREDFNRVQVNDRATVRIVDRDLSVLDVREDANDVRTTDVRPFDFLGLHEDDGLDAERW